MLALLSAGDPAAFASDQDHRITFWNKGAERMTGRGAAHALGRLCHEVFSGRDMFGNRFCSESCPVSQTIKRHEAVNRFEMRTGDPQHPQDVGVTVVEIPDPRRGFHTAVHILDRVEEKSWLTREVVRLREVAGALVRKGITSADGSIPNRLQLSPSTVPPTKRPAKLNGTFAEPLSDREMDVLRAIASGRANKEIASSLQISVATTRNHIQHILKKLDVHTKLEAMALAFRNGWTS